MAKSELRVWAKKGAEQRLVEIAEEAKAIFAAFPELRSHGRGFISAGGAAAPAAEPRGKEKQAGRRRKRTMSAEARKRIGDAQRARWAKQKATGNAARSAESVAPSPARASRKKR
jgi:hypothetical protein